MLTAADVRFVRSFRMPIEVAGTDASWGTGLALRRVDGEVRLFSSTVREVVYEVRAADGALVRAWGDVTSAARVLDGAGRGGGSLRGLFWDEATQRLWWTYGDGYNTASGNDPSVGCSRLDAATGTGRPDGVWRFADRSCKMTMGGVLAVPPTHASSFGGRRLAAGMGGYFSIATTGPVSMGPALTAFDPAEALRTATAGAVTNTPLVGYPFTGAPDGTVDRCHRDTDYRTEFDAWTPNGNVGFFTWTDYIGQAGVWIDTPAVHGVLMMPTLGHGRVWYETSTLHAERVTHDWLVLDPAQLAQVAAGQRPQWSVQPTTSWTMQYPGIAYPQPGWANEPFNMVVGSVYDPIDARLYVAVRDPWSPNHPDAGHVIAVYDIATT